MRIRRGVIHTSMAFCFSCSTPRIQNALAAFCRRIRSRLDSPKAITGTVLKISCVFHRMLKHEQSYIELGLEQYEKKYKERIVKNLQKNTELGFIPLPRSRLCLEFEDVS